MDSTTFTVPEQRSPRRSPTAERFLIRTNRAIYRVARHWLWPLNLLGAVFAVAPFLAPALMALGQTGPASWIYRAFSLICTQVPEHTFHLLGYPLACCERCLAIYLALLALGLAFPWLRRRIAPASLTAAVVLSLPMASDGLSQLLGVRQSDWELRVLTGTLFAAALAWFIYPRLDAGFREICDTLEARFARLAAEGRAAPL